MPVPPIQDVLDLLQQKEVKTAIDLLEQTVEQVPAHLPAHVILARAYEAKGQWNRALQAWEQAHFLLPNSPVAQEGKQRVLQRIEEADASVETKASSSTTDLESKKSSDSTADSDSKPSPDPVGIDESEGPSTLEELRQQTEEESKQGRAQSGLETTTPPSDRSATPEDQVEQLQDAAPDSDLDQLIDELESAHIEPQPEMEEVSESGLDDDADDLVSETLARIHAAQEQYGEAARIYRELATQEPDRSQEFLERAAEMREKAEAMDGEA